MLPPESNPLAIIEQMFAMLAARDMEEAEVEEDPPQPTTGSEVGPPDTNTNPSDGEPEAP